MGRRWRHYQQRVDSRMTPSPEDHVQFQWRFGCRYCTNPWEEGCDISLSSMRQGVKDLRPITYEAFPLILRKYPSRGQVVLKFTKHNHVSQKANHVYFWQSRSFPITRPYLSKGQPLTQFAHHDLTECKFSNSIHAPKRINPSMAFPLKLILRTEFKIHYYTWKFNLMGYKEHCSL